MKQQTRGLKVQVKCQCCKNEFIARVADRKRGWAKFCSKSCKAKIQEVQTGQYARFLRAENRPEVEEEFGWDAHKNAW